MGLLRSFVHGFLYVFVWVLLVVSSVCSGRGPTGLDRLEAITNQAATLEDFLNNSTLVREYFDELNAYYGDKKVEGDKYHTILNQLRRMIQYVPELKVRAWQKSQPTEDMVIASEMQTFGRVFHRKNWEKFYRDWENRLREASGHFATLEGDSFKQEANALMGEVNRLISEAEVKIAGLARKERERRMGELYRSVQNRADVKALLNNLVLRHVGTPHARKLLNSQNADFILNHVKDLRENPKAIFESSGIRPNTTVLPVTKGILPDVQVLAPPQGGGVFPQYKVRNREGNLVPIEVGKKTEYVFRNSPRPFHGFFKGMFTKECVGGSCVQSTDNITEERWATSALEGTHLQYIERDGKCLGYIQAVPQNSNAGKVASIDIGSPSLRMGVVERMKDGEYRTVPLFTAWFHQMMRGKKPADWNGFILGANDRINNSGVLPLIRFSPAYLTGQTVDHVTHVDPMAAQIPKYSNKTTTGYVHYYAGNMILDAQVKGQGALTLLRDTDQSLEEIVRSHINAGNYSWIQNMILTLASSSFNNNRETDHRVLMYQLQQAGILQLLADSGYRFPDEEKVKRSHTNLENFAEMMREAHFTIEDIKAAKTFMSLYGAEGFVAEQLPHTKSASEFNELLQLVDGAYLGRLISSHINHFVSLHPTADDVKELMNMTPGQHEHVLAPLQVRLATSGADYLKHVREFLSNVHDSHIQDAIYGTSEHFLSLQPTEGEKSELYEILKDIRVRVPFEEQPEHFTFRKALRHTQDQELHHHIQTAGGLAGVVRLLEAELAQPGADHQAVLEVFEPTLTRAAESEMSPQLRQEFQRQLNITGNLTKGARQLQGQLELTMAGSPKDYFGVVDRLLVGVLTPEQITGIIDKTLPGYLKLEPTAEEKQRMEAYSSHDVISKEALKLLAPQPGQATTAEEFVKSLAYPSGLEGKQEIRSSREALAIEALDHFCSLPLTMTDVLALKKYITDGETLYKINQMALDRNLVTNGREFLDLMDSNVLSAELTAAKKKMIRESFRKQFLSRDFTLHDAMELKGWLTDPGAVSELMKNTVARGKVTTPDEYASLIGATSGLTADETAQVNNKIVLETLPELFAMHPSTADLQKVTSAGWVSPSTHFRLGSREIAELFRNPEQAKPTVPSLLSQFGQVSEDHGLAIAKGLVEGITFMNEMPGEKDTAWLKEQLRTSLKTDIPQPIWQELAKGNLILCDSPQEFSAQLKELGYLSSGNPSRLQHPLNESVEHLVSLAPTAQDKAEITGIAESAGLSRNALAYLNNNPNEARDLNAYFDFFQALPNDKRAYVGDKLIGRTLAHFNTLSPTVNDFMKLKGLVTDPREFGKILNAAVDSKIFSNEQDLLKLIEYDANVTPLVKPVIEGFLKEQINNILKAIQNPEAAFHLVKFAGSHFDEKTTKAVCERVANLTADNKSHWLSLIHHASAIPQPEARSHFRTSLMKNLDGYVGRRALTEPEKQELAGALFGRNSELSATEIARNVPHTLLLKDTPAEMITALEELHARLPALLPNLRQAASDIVESINSRNPSIDEIAKLKPYFTEAAHAKAVMGALERGICHTPNDYLQLMTPIAGVSSDLVDKILETAQSHFFLKNPTPAEKEALYAKLSPLFQSKLAIEELKTKRSPQEYGEFLSSPRFAGEASVRDAAIRESLSSYMKLNPSLDEIIRLRGEAKSLLLKTKLEIQALRKASGPAEYLKVAKSTFDRSLSHQSAVFNRTVDRFFAGNQPTFDHATELLMQSAKVAPESGKAADKVVSHAGNDLSKIMRHAVALLKTKESHNGVEAALLLNRVADKISKSKDPSVIEARREVRKLLADLSNTEGSTNPETKLSYTKTAFSLSGNLNEFFSVIPQLASFDPQAILDSNISGRFNQLAGEREGRIERVAAAGAHISGLESSARDAVLRHCLDQGATIPEVLAAKKAVLDTATYGDGVLSVLNKFAQERLLTTPRAYTQYYEGLPEEVREVEQVGARAKLDPFFKLNPSIEEATAYLKVLKFNPWDTRLTDAVVRLLKMGPPTPAQYLDRLKLLSDSSQIESAIKESYYAFTSGNPSATEIRELKSKIKASNTELHLKVVEAGIPFVKSVDAAISLLTTPVHGAPTVQEIEAFENGKNRLVYEWSPTLRKLSTDKKEWQRMGLPQGIQRMIRSCSDIFKKRKFN